MSTASLRPNYRAVIGMITPSANLVVERVTWAILADFPEVSGHFSRTPVFGAKDLFPDDYDWDGMLSAARLLAQARPDVIVWNGSKGATLGFATDREFCRRVTEETGVPATTSSLALEAALGRLGGRRVAVVTPYTTDYQNKLIEGLEREGLDVVAQAHAGIGDNLDFAAVSDAAIAGMIDDVAAAKPDAILTWCTNFPAAYGVDALEREHDIPILDSVTLAVWHGLHMVDRADGRGRRWGRLFDERAK
ncbi:MAG TPA: aspartate/glutamate racemase family protein [Xanthobacteraceae bacterium]|nr:aspartate/glutamate racemase family protein [Xanthobacteraceae bacterium]